MARLRDEGVGIERLEVSFWQAGEGFGSVKELTHEAVVLGPLLGFFDNVMGAEAHIGLRLGAALDAERYFRPRMAFCNWISSTFCLN